MITKGQLNRMCKYFKNKNVCMTYEYNNSLNLNGVREYSGKYDSFEIKEFFCGYKTYTIIFKLNNKWVMEEDFSEDAEFIGVGKIRELNSGPYCYFTIIKNDLYTKIKNIFK